MLNIEHFTKIYGNDHVAVDDLSLTVNAGDIYGFIGHNGAGKTTTLRAVAGILDFERGSITVGGRSIREEPLACKRMMAYIPDNPDLYDYLTGAQYFRFVADLYEVPADKRNARIEKYAAAFEMETAVGGLIGSMSHDMKQKVAIIAALLHEPELLLLDEPFVGLDPVAAHVFKELLHKLCARGGAVFFSTHVLDVAEKLCDKVAIIKDGRLVAFGDTDKVRGDGSLEELFLELIDQ